MSWYCLTVPPTRELAAVRALSEHCNAFTPVEYVHQRTPQLGKNKIVRPRPLFGRYVFVENPPWYAINSLMIPGTLQRAVTGVLSAGSRIPYRLPDDDLMRVQYLAEHGPPQVAPSRGIQPGDIVMISDGPFKGFKVKVLGRSTETHAMVEFTMLASLREIEVPVQMLEAA